MTSASLPTDPASQTAATRQVLSALVDGEVARAGKGAADDFDKVLAAWRDDGEARQAWHSYQLIGDVLRSEDLARAPADDLAFLSRFRDRLEAEPLHHAPPFAAAAAAPRQPALASKPTPAPMRWQAGFALAASVAVVAVALLLVKSAGSGLSPESSPALARQDLPAADAGRVTPVLAVSSSGVLRDPRLDEFLRMHQMARGGLAVGVPGGSLQRADLQMPGGSER